MQAYGDKNLYVFYFLPHWLYAIILYIYFFQPPSSVSSSTVAAVEPSATPQSAPVATKLASDDAISDASVSDTTYFVAASNAYVHRQLGKLPVERAPRTSQSEEGIPTQDSQTFIVWDVCPPKSKLRLLFGNNNLHYSIISVNSFWVCCGVVSSLVLQFLAHNLS